MRATIYTLFTLLALLVVLDGPVIGGSGGDYGGGRQRNAIRLQHRRSRRRCRRVARAAAALFVADEMKSPQRR